MSGTDTPLDLTVTRLGDGGDGAAAAPDGATLYIPRTLPGEHVLAVRTGGARATCTCILTPSPDRVVAPCPHFDRCGGCALQHLGDDAYADWKRGRVARALAYAGFEQPTLSPLVRTPPGARRRMDFGARRSADGVVLGLHAAGSDTLIDIHTCLVLAPSLVRLLPALRALLGGLQSMRRRADILANLLPDGPDLLLRLDAPVTAPDRTRLAAFAAAQGISRIACSAKAGAVNEGPAEIAVQLGQPTITFGTARVSPPPGAFLQASPAGERAIVSAVLAGLPAKLTGRPRIIELFAGIGTLTFPLAARARVVAYEGNAQAAAALRRGAAGGRIEVHHQDLTRQPVQAAALAGAAAIVLDPPFAGALAQMPPIAASGVPVVIYVSCNPASLAQDTTLLHRAGYRLAAATPIDQFLWSAQVEAVCVFVRPR